MKYYFDDEEGEGPARETSHPSFVKGMKADFYYDCTDEFAPFGNDDGADLLFNLEDWYREKKLSRNITRWMFREIDQMGFEYSSEDCAKLLDPEALDQIMEEEEYLIPTMDNTIIATAFGQIKITGKIDPKLKKLTLTAIDRQEHLNREEEEYLQRLTTMRSDLEAFQ